jgi:parallel beta-helix repeat protein
MRGNVFRKGLAIGIILLFLYSIVVSGFKININNKNNTLSYGRGNTLYVGGSGQGNFSNIQDAIDYSNNGDTIFVYRGVYPADIVIDKSIILLGEDRDMTIVKGGWDGFLIDVDSVTIKNFTITECGQFWNRCAILVTTNDNIISNNKIINNDKLNCIKIDHSNNNLISGNNISDNIYFGIRLEYANNNVIVNNYVNNNKAFGMSISAESSDNIFISNTVSSNLWGGVSVTQDCENNIFYHNNFINNDIYPFDSGINIWNDSYPSGGNYWTEYNGNDSFQGVNQDISGSDGIGDTPYPIPGGDNKDRYPLMKPYGFPNPPIISGPTSGKPNVKYEYLFSLTGDPDGEDCFLFVDWGDGNTIDWQGPYESGTVYFASHQWSEKAVFTIKCKVKDIHGLESQWGTLNVTMPRNKIITELLLQRFFQNHPYLFQLL